MYRCTGIVNINIYRYFNYSGEHDLEDDKESDTFQYKADLMQVDVHPNFFIRRSRGKIEYDVAILTLKTAIDFGNDKFKHIRSVSLRCSV